MNINKILLRIPIISLLNSGWQMASEGYSEKSPSYRRKQQWKIVFHILVNPLFAKKWFEALKEPLLREVSTYRSSLYIKPFRPYISIKWSKRQAIKVILDTYRFLKAQKGLFEEVLTQKEGKIIASVMLDEVTEGVLKLGYDYRFRKEGELVLSFECDRLGGKVVSAAFSLEEEKNGDWLCRLGCVQGHVAHKSFKASQKLLHGLRPNAFITFAVQELARNFGCKAIYATGNSIQAFRRKHFINLPWIHNINFDYDQFWLESGGQKIENGWFELPLIPVRKSVQEIPSHKRAVYRRRYEILDNLSLKISDTVKTFS